MIEFELDASEIVKALAETERNLDRFMVEAVRAAGQAIAARAKREHDYEDDTGHLTNSIMSLGASGSFSKGNLEAAVAAGAPHGVFLEYGTKLHRVKPKHRKALRWGVEGGFAFSRGHWVSGIRPREFLSDALEDELDEITEEMEAATELAFHKAGLR